MYLYTHVPVYIRMYVKTTSYVCKWLSVQRCMCIAYVCMQRLVCLHTAIYARLYEPQKGADARKQLRMINVASSNVSLA